MSSRSHLCNVQEVGTEHHSVEMAAVYAPKFSPVLHKRLLHKRLNKEQREADLSIQLRSAAAALVEEKHQRLLAAIDKLTTSADDKIAKIQATVKSRNITISDLRREVAAIRQDSLNCETAAAATAAREEKLQQQVSLLALEKEKLRNERDELNRQLDELRSKFREAEHGNSLNKTPCPAENEQEAMLQAVHTANQNQEVKSACLSQPQQQRDRFARTVQERVEKLFVEHVRRSAASSTASTRLAHKKKSATRKERLRTARKHSVLCFLGVTAAVMLVLLLSAPRYIMGMQQQNLSSTTRSLPGDENTVGALDTTKNTLSAASSAVVEREEQLEMAELAGGTQKPQEMPGMVWPTEQLEGQAPVIPSAATTPNDGFDVHTVLLLEIVSGLFEEASFSSHYYI
jgi:hypothetical protein